MTFLRFLFNLTILCVLVIVLNTRIESVPPIGKFMDPFIGFWQNADPIVPQNSNASSLPGLTSEVNIYYDSMLIPHIYANSDLDALFAIGFVTAKHRLWQMELQTFAASGRLSEIFGRVTLDYDRQRRRIGMTTSAKLTEEAWLQNDDIKTELEAFTAGVNAYISQLEESQYPIEYKIFDYKPEPWSVYKMALVLKYMSAMLTLNERDLENTNVVSMFGRDTYDKLFPDYPEGIEPVVREPSNQFLNVKQVIIPDSVRINVPLITKVLPQPNENNGSNNWAVGSAKSVNGNAILANDMHLDMNLPNIWFQAHTIVKGKHLFGNYVPGVPYAITGCNDSVAWGYTSANRDFVDWFKIDFKNGYKNEYRYDGKWLKTHTVVEEIKIRNEQSLLDTVIYTHLGPVVYDNSYLPENPRLNLAMKWVVHEVSYEPLAFSNVNKANNFADFKQEVEHHSCPPLNMAFASRKGDIAMVVQGAYPLKFKDQGKFILDGTTSKTDWTSHIPDEDDLYELNPSRNYVSSANQHPGNSDYPYYSYNANYEYYRNRRINKVLDSTEFLSVKDHMNLQYDAYGLKAEEILPLLLDTLSTENLSREKLILVEALQEWDYKFRSEFVAPFYFETWWNAFYRLLWDEFYDANIALRRPTSYVTYLLMKQNELGAFCDVKSTPVIENYADLVQQSFDSAFVQINESKSRKWYLQNKVSVNHFTRIPAFGYTNLKVNGSRKSPLATSGNHGPSQHMIIEMGNEVKIWNNYPGGQSGNPGSYFYDTFLNDWIKGIYFELDFSIPESKIQSNALYHQRLKN